MRSNENSSLFARQTKCKKLPLNALFSSKRNIVYKMRYSVFIEQQNVFSVGSALFLGDQMLFLFHHIQIANNIDYYLSEHSHSVNIHCDVLLDRRLFAIQTHERRNKKSKKYSWIRHDDVIRIRLHQTASCWHSQKIYTQTMCDVLYINKKLCLRYQNECK